MMRSARCTLGRGSGRGIGGGILVTLIALRMYVFPLAGFLSQLEELPPTWEHEERRLVNTLFPGARGWTTPELMQNLRSLGFPAEMSSMEATAFGAKCRAHRWEDADCSRGLRVRRRLLGLSAKQATSRKLSRG